MQNAYKMYAYYTRGSLGMRTRTENEHQLSF